MTEELEPTKREGGDENQFTQPLGELDTAHACNLTHDRTIILCQMTNGYVLRFHSTSKPDDRERFFQMALTPEGMQAVVFLYGLFGKHDRDAIAFWRELDEAERQSLQGSVEETHAQFNEENRGDLVVSLLQLVARWLGGDTRPDTIARTFDAGQTVRLDFGATHLESLAAEIQKITYVGAPGQRVGDNVRLAVPVQTVRDFVAFAECACDVHGDKPGDCMVCRVTDALYIATGEECYHREPPSVVAVALERLHPIEDQLNDPLRLARDDFEQKAGVSTATVEEHRQRAEVILRRMQPGDRVTFNSAARDAVAFDLALAEDWRSRFDLTVDVDDEDARLTKNGAPVVTMTEVEGFATLDGASAKVVEIDEDAATVERNREVITGQARTMQPGDHLSLNPLAARGAGFNDLKALHAYAEEQRLHVECKTTAAGFAVTFTKAEPGEEELRFDFDVKKTKGGE